MEECIGTLLREPSIESYGTLGGGGADNFSTVQMIDRIPAKVRLPKLIDKTAVALEIGIEINFALMEEYRNGMVLLSGNRESKD